MGCAPRTRFKGRSTACCAKIYADNTRRLLDEYEALDSREIHAAWLHCLPEHTIVAPIRLRRKTKRFFLYLVGNSSPAIYM